MIHLYAASGRGRNVSAPGFVAGGGRVTILRSILQWGWTQVIPRLTFFVLAFLLVSVAIGDAVLVAYLFSKGTVDSLRPVKLLRFMVSSVNISEREKGASCNKRVSNLSPADIRTDVCLHNA
jgi:hypothetical protein